MNAHPLIVHDPQAVLSCAFSPDGEYLLTASRDKTLAVWRGGQAVWVVKHAQAVHDCAWSADSSRFVSCSTDRSAARPCGPVPDRSTSCAGRSRYGACIRAVASACCRGTMGLASVHALRRPSRGSRPLCAIDARSSATPRPCCASHGTLASSSRPVRAACCGCGTPVLH